MESLIENLVLSVLNFVFMEVLMVKLFEVFDLIEYVWFVIVFIVFDLVNDFLVDFLVLFNFMLKLLVRGVFFVG